MKYLINSGNRLGLIYDTDGLTKEYLAKNEIIVCSNSVYEKYIKDSNCSNVFEAETLLIEAHKEDDEIILNDSIIESDSISFAYVKNDKELQKCTTLKNSKDFTVDITFYEQQLNDEKIVFAHIDNEYNEVYEFEKLSNGLNQFIDFNFESLVDMYNRSEYNQLNNGQVTYQFGLYYKGLEVLDDIDVFYSNIYKDVMDGKYEGIEFKVVADRFVFDGQQEILFSKEFTGDMLNEHFLNSHINETLVLKDFEKRINAGEDIPVREFSKINYESSSFDKLSNDSKSAIANYVNERSDKTIKVQLDELARKKQFDVEIVF